MPHEVIMPALGMAQDTGQLLAWHKKPGEAVTAGDVLFEVETDKAAMEVEAQSGGYLTDVTAQAGADVPVGQVIALISETPEDSGSAPVSNGAAAPEKAAGPDGADTALPEGSEVIMPTLGMAQDTGLLIAWRKEPGEPVAADDILFEVETDKSAVEVNAGVDGFVAARLAEAGEDVPVGRTIAVISAEKPESPVQRSVAAGAAASAGQASVVAKAAEEPVAPAPSTAEPKAARIAGPAGTGGRILASPKARRLALEQGLDLARLLEAGYEQPYHVKDLETLKALPPARAEIATGAVPARHLSAEIDGGGFDEFAAWAGDNAGLSDANALIAGLAAASLGRLPSVIAVETFGGEAIYSVPTAWLGEVSKAEVGAVPELKIRDLRHSRIGTLQLGAEDCPVISIVRARAGLGLTLECAGHHLAAEEAVSLLSNFAGRMEQPLRHLL